MPDKETRRPETPRAESKDFNKSCVHCGKKTTLRCAICRQPACGSHRERGVCPGCAR